MTMKKLSPLAKQTQTGTTLIEVLVALLVFTIGLQGAMSLQYQAMKDNFDSSQRSHGSWIAHELINRIRANVTGRESGQYCTGGDCTVTTVVDRCAGAAPTSCVGFTCTNAQMAAFDIRDAICQGTLLTPKISISCTDSDGADGLACSAGSDFTLALEWDSKSVADDSDDTVINNIASGQVIQQFQQVFQP